MTIINDPHPKREAARFVGPPTLKSGQVCGSRTARVALRSLEECKIMALAKAAVTWPRMKKDTSGGLEKRWGYRSSIVDWDFVL